MRVVAINGSPKMNKGATALILGPFLEGMREAGAEVGLFYTRKLDIKPCHGDFRCSTDTPGICIHKDDMQMLHPELCEADVWVMATPVYVSGMTGPLKNLIDRILIPLGEPNVELRDGHCHHPMRKEVKRGAVILVSTCGYWELDNFDLLLAQMKAFCDHAEREFAGALLRPHGPVLRAMVKQGAQVSDILEAAREAGQQMGENQQMAVETLAKVSRPLLPLEAYLR
ncbi:MAG: flavodoxin family protein [Anaerolineales bacterium]|jgi:multimeric flavodoxin WrbA